MRRTVLHIPALQTVKESGGIAVESKDTVLINNLSFRISERQILEKINMSVGKSSLTGLIGPNGSGKTTLLKHIYRALRPQKNTVYINGADITELSYKQSARDISVLRQEHGSDFPYTIIDMVLMGRSPYHRLFEGDSADDRQMAMEALTRVGMAEFAERGFSELSGGEKQRVLIARALTQGADILLLDEPTNHLDVYYQWKLMELIKGLGKTVLAVFHELNLACAFCDYIYVLKDGYITDSGRPADVCTREMLKKVFNVKADVSVDEDNVPHIIWRGAL